LHWGVSAGHVNLTAYQVELAHHAIDVGADPVFGHHPHCLQGIEVYRGKAIFYSLGNFSFARHNPGAGHELETCILRCSLQDRRITTVEYLPVCCDARLDPHLLSVAEGRALVGIIEERSAAFGTAFGESERDPGYAVGRCWCKRTSRPVIRSVVYGKPFDAN
jgi:poly-gamma-glutamate synthesis protein (capsule biosynthesis protein)